VSGNRQEWEVMPIVGSEGDRFYQGSLKGGFIQLKKEQLMGWSGDPVPEWEVQHVHNQHRWAGKSLTIVPAYGRDYKSKKAVEADWNADKDFIVQDMMSGYDGSFVNKSDAKRMGVSHVTVRYKQLRNVTVIKVAAQDKIASRYNLPAKSGGEIVFGIDRAMGWFFQLWIDEDDPELDKSFLSNGALLELLEKYGKPSRHLDKAIQAVALDMEPADFGVKGIRAAHTISRKKKSKGCGCRKESSKQRTPSRRRNRNR